MENECDSRKSSIIDQPKRNNTAGKPHSIIYLFFTISIFFRLHCYLSYSLCAARLALAPFRERLFEPPRITLKSLEEEPHGIRWQKADWSNAGWIHFVVQIRRKVSILLLVEERKTLTKKIWFLIVILNIPEESGTSQIHRHPENWHLRDRFSCQCTNDSTTVSPSVPVNIPR